jgi:hypothetical protein
MDLRIKEAKTLFWLNMLIRLDLCFPWNQEQGVGQVGVQNSSKKKHTIKEDHYKLVSAVRLTMRVQLK